jgi:hypothetical protein
MELGLYLWSRRTGVYEGVETGLGGYGHRRLSQRHTATCMLSHNATQLHTVSHTATHAATPHSLTNSHTATHAATPHSLTNRHLASHAATLLALCILTQPHTQAPKDPSPAKISPGRTTFFAQPAKDKEAGSRPDSAKGKEAPKPAKKQVQ